MSARRKKGAQNTLALSVELSDCLWMSLAVAGSQREVSLCQRVLRCVEIRSRGSTAVVMGSVS